MSLVIKVRPRPGPVDGGDHERVQVFAGPDRDHLALAGEIVLRRVEWDLLRSRLRLEQGRHEELGVSFVVGA